MRRLLCRLGDDGPGLVGRQPDGSRGLARCPGLRHRRPRESGRTPRRDGAGARQGAGPQLGRRDGGLSRGPRALAQPGGVQPSPPALRDPLQAEPPLPGQSFRNVLLALPHDQAAELYDEVLERIQSNYVDAVPWEPLVRHGLDNLEVALRDPVFLKTNAPLAAPERVTWLRETSAPVSREPGDPRPRGGDPHGRGDAASSASGPSAWPPRPCCWNSPTAPATPSTTTRAT